MLTLTLTLTLTLRRAQVSSSRARLHPCSALAVLAARAPFHSRICFASEGSSASDAPAYSGGASAAGSDQGQYIDPPDQGAPSAEGVSPAAHPELGSALRRLDTLTPTDEELPVQLASNGARPCMRSVLALFTAECYPPG